MNERPQQLNWSPEIISIGIAIGIGSIEPCSGLDPGKTINHEDTKGAKRDLVFAFVVKKAAITMYHGVKSVKAIEGHKLIIGFDNGEFRVFNVKPLLSLGRFCELTSQQEFMKAKVSFDTVEWENGLDPEYLYERSEAM